MRRPLKTPTSSGITLHRPAALTSVVPSVKK
nr:MAG TPA: hypothetical protein [Caudoviricetes sp.]